MPRFVSPLRFSSRLRHAVVATAMAALALQTACSRSQPALASAPAAVTAGPPHGTLVIAGGGRIGPEIVARFLELAGGPAAPIVVIPTAVGDSAYPPDWSGAQFLRDGGATNLTILHTGSRDEANSERFVAAIRRARAVWFPGGRQWRLVDSYLGTRTERELHALLSRGGVIGGTSAGASIQASYLVRGARETNLIVMGPGYEQGFGFLRNAAVDQHVLVRKRLDDLPQVLRAHPTLLGIGIDEETAIVVRGATFDVIGASKVFVYGGHDHLDARKPYVILEPGDRYDLAARATSARTHAAGSQ
jgi:cyanophycinase